MKRLLTIAALALCATATFAQKYMKVEYSNGTVLNIPMKYVDKIAPATHIEPVIETVTSGEFGIGDLITVTGQHLDLIQNFAGITDFTTQTPTKLTFLLTSAWQDSDHLAYYYTGLAFNEETTQDMLVSNYCLLDTPITLKPMKLNSVMDAQRGVAVSSTDTISVAQGDVRLEIDGESLDRLSTVRIGDKILPDTNWQSGRTDSHISLLVPTQLADGTLTFIYDQQDDNEFNYKSTTYGYIMNEMPRVSVVECLSGSLVRLQCDNLDAWGIDREGSSVFFTQTPSDNPSNDSGTWLWLSKDFNDEQYFCLYLFNETEGYLRIDNKFGSHSWLYINYVEPTPDPDPDPDPTPDPDPDPDPTPDGVTELWAGQVVCDDWTPADNSYILSDSGTELQAAGAKAGDVLHFYIECTSSTYDWQMQIFEGHWGEQYVDAGSYDIAETNGAVDLELTDEILQKAYIQQWWGGTFVVQGDNVILTKITLEHK